MAPTNRFSLVKLDCPLVFIFLGYLLALFGLKAELNAVVFSQFVVILCFGSAFQHLKNALNLDQVQLL